MYSKFGASASSQLFSTVTKSIKPKFSKTETTYRLLNESIQSCTSVQQLNKLLQTKKPSDLDAVNCTAAFRVLGKASVRPDTHTVEKLLSLCEPVLFPPRNLSACLHTIASTQLLPSLPVVLLHKLEQHPALHKFNGQDISTTVWSLAKMNEQSKVLPKLADVVIHKKDLTDYSPQSLANIVWSFATLRAFDLVLAKRIGQELLHRADWSLFSAQAVANLCWAFATMEYKEEKLWERLCFELTTRRNIAQDFSSQQISNMVWSLAVVNFLDVPLLTQFACAIKKNPSLYSPQALSISLWGFAMLNFRDDDMCRAVATEIESRPLASFSSQHLTNIMLGFALVDFAISESFCNHVAQELCQQRDVSSFASQELVDLLFAFTCLNMLHVPNVKLWLNTSLPPNFAIKQTSRSAQQLWQTKLCVKESSTLLDCFFKGDWVHSLRKENTKFLSDTHLAVVSGLKSKFHLESNPQGLVLPVSIYIPKYNAVVEIEAQQHFLSNLPGEVPTGRTQLKHRILKQEGFALFPVSAVEYRKKSSGQQREYLRALVNQIKGE